MTTPGHTRPPGVIVVTPWYGGIRGGVAIAVESLVQGLIASGVKTVAMRVTPDRWLPHVRRGSVGEEIIDVCVRPRPSAAGSLSARLGFGIRAALARRTLRRLVRQYDARIIHFNFAVESYAILAEQARALGLKVVTTFHGADVNATLFDPATSFIVEDIVRASHHVAVVSKTLHDRLLSAIPELAPRLSLIHNGVPTSFAIAAAQMTDADAPPLRWDVLLVGRLIPRKGGDVLLDALVRVRAKLPAVRLGFAGTGPFEPELRAQVERLGLGANVDFVGEISRVDMSPAYRATKVLAIPSRSEGLPLVLLEALWLGIPVVASAVDGLPEVVIDNVNGLLVPAEDPEALAGALLRLLMGTEMHDRLSAQARASIADRYSPESITAQYRDVYDAVLREP